MYPTVSLTSQVIRSVTEENCSRCHPSGWVTAETDMFEVAWREKNSIIAMSRLECPDRLIGKSRCRGLNLALFLGGVSGGREAHQRWTRSVRSNYTQDTHVMRMALSVIPTKPLFTSGFRTAFRRPSALNLPTPTH